MEDVKRTTEFGTLDALLEIAVGLTQSLSSASRYQRLLAAVRQVVPADGLALLRLSEGMLTPIAVDGLAPELLGHRFDPAEHPRLAAILDARGPIEFPPDSPLPDPYDGFLHAEGLLHEDDPIHSCMGTTLRLDDEVVGVLTMDAARANRFREVDPRALEAFAALASAALHTAGLIDALETKAARTGAVAQHLVEAALTQHGGELLGASQAMERLRSELEMVAESDLTVLISGETGTGKELVARTLHAHSERRGQPLVYINCAALPESLAESELFGHRRGAFTGAVSDRPGKFELADGGTLLLDEVGELPLGVQAVLLRALQFGEVQRVGADQPVTVDVRILAATNRDLASEVRAGRFRADLYHRLSVYPIVVPPLRDRVEDVAPLAGAFLDAARRKLGGSAFRLSPGSLRALQAFPWPGNVRELEHVIQRAVLRCSRSTAEAGRVRVIHREHLGTIEPVLAAAPASVEPSPVALGQERSLRDATEEFQRQFIEAAVRAQEGNWAAAARRLGVDRGNLYRRAGRLGLR